MQYLIIFSDTALLFGIDCHSLCKWKAVNKIVGCFLIFIIPLISLFNNEHRVEDEFSCQAACILMCTFIHLGNVTELNVLSLIFSSCPDVYNRPIHHILQYYGLFLSKLQSCTDFHTGSSERVDHICYAVIANICGVSGLHFPGSLIKNGV